MSTISCLVLVVLCCSLHACNARRFGVHVYPAKGFHLSKNNEEELNPSRAFIKPNRKYSTLPDAAAETKMQNKSEEKKVESENNKNNNNEPGKHIIQDGMKGAFVVKKSWKVAQRKKGNQGAEFNQDYLHPRTHPPVHN